MEKRHIVVVPYDPRWKDDFKAIRRELEAAVGDKLLSVEHVGSTSVEGLAAKPIIDIDIVIADETVLPAVIRGLAAIGYEHEGDLGIVGREAFRYADKPHLQAHHLYVCPQNSRELHRHLTFRDYLRRHPEAVEEYGRVKMEAARLFPHDIERYMQHKDACIRRLYEECGL